jgi:hypothetical protein
LLTQQRKHAHPAGSRFAGGQAMDARKRGQVRR